MAVAVQADRAVTVPIRAGERFYVGMAVACLALTVLGFAPTYWVPMMRGTLQVAPIAHVHAALFYGWMLLFVKQSALIASRRVARHREMGVLGVALASGMLLVGLATAVTSLKQGIDAGNAESVRAFTTLPVAPYAPVRRQLLLINRAVNRLRAAAGEPLVPVDVLALRRRVVKPFAGVAAEPNELCSLLHR